MATVAYIKALSKDIDALGGTLITDMSEKRFNEEFQHSDLTWDQVGLVQECARQENYTEFYRDHPSYVELPSGAGFAWFE